MIEVVTGLSAVIFVAHAFAAFGMHQIPQRLFGSAN